MNELKQLKELHIEQAKKQRDFDKVTKRLSKTIFPWQVPAALLGVMMIGFFLLLTWSAPREITADTKPELTAVYSVYGEGNPYSIWQMWVTRSTDAAVLNEFATILQDAKRVEKISDTAELFQTQRFVYSDGTSVKYKSYSSPNATYFYDVNNTHYYELTDDIRYYMIETMDGYSDAKKYRYVMAISLVFYLILNHLVGRKMRDEEDKKRRISNHSTHWQLVVTASAFACIAFVALMVPNVHYFVAVIIFSVASIGNILLERNFGQNGWRMLNFVMNNCWYIFILMGLFLM